MFQFILRLFLIIVCSFSGYLIFIRLWGFPLALIGLISGIILSLFIIVLEKSIRRLPLKTIIGGTGGLLFGIAISFLLIYGFRYFPQEDISTALPWEYLFVLATCVLGYMGLLLGSMKAGELGFSAGALSAEDECVNARILDTSVIIDGRLADICDTGFIDGTLIVPRFVLEELQQIADSSDHLKRSRGRRGLEVLNKMQKSPGIRIDIVDIDFPKVKGVDAKLVQLAKTKDGRIVTNDYNLNRIAELQGIKILNVNELANALKPVVLPGETMVVKVIKEGKEQGQGVAYLDDGTMVVVDNAVKYQGRSVEVVVTSVLQTTAGRMIFSDLKNVVP